ncbi:hypothetical protein DYH10_01435 [Candidatus Saccharibacteria bacterium CPR2]|nr:hypothetical protein [Candidatus Saccharibacteria bacterium CPR2]
MSKKIIAFVGMPGSGKGTCTDYLASKGYPVIHFGNMVYEEIQRRGLDNVKDEKFVRLDMRRKEGLSVLAKRASRKADQYFKQGKKTVILDGLYSWSEYMYLEKKYGEELVVICVFTPRNVRYQRVISRKDSHRAYTVEQIKNREIDEIENFEKGGPIARADYCLTNTKSPRELLKELDELMDEITADNHAAS